MPTFRKKPVEIEAVQITRGLGLIETPAPDWIKEAIRSGAIREASANGWTISTIEGDMTASPGDWIIQGVMGEIYPCKPDIFAATYDPVL